MTPPAVLDHLTEKELVMGRKHIGRVVAVLALVLAVAGLVLTQLGAQGSKLNPVKVQIGKGAKTADGKEVINITFEVEKNWHIYANPVGDETIANAATVVLVEPKDKVKIEVQYPKGKDKKDDILGISYRVYVDKVTIPVHVQRVGGDSTPLDVTVKYQACDKNHCLPEAVVKQKVQ
jgi:hypothetical protein